jgi:hypothetical protein
MFIKNNFLQNLFFNAEKINSINRKYKNNKIKE